MKIELSAEDMAHKLLSRFIKLNVNTWFVSSRDVVVKKVEEYVIETITLLQEWKDGSKDIRETSDPIIAVKWLGKKVECAKAFDDEEQPWKYNEETDDYTILPVKGILTGITQGGVWIGEVGCEWPVRLVE